LGKAKYDEPVHKDDILHRLPISLDHDLSTSEEETRLVMEEQGLATIDELVSGQKSMLEYGIIWSKMTWCGNDVPNMKLKRECSFICLILKRVGVEGMRFRRVGYAEVLDGHCFEEVVPDVLELI
jgi:hypothetical protein